MIHDWLPKYLLRVVDSFDPHDWPSGKTEAWTQFEKEWRSAFARHGVSEAEADSAREVACEDPPRFKPDYIPKIMSAVKALRELGATTGTASPLDDRESAVNASKGCFYCNGIGFAVVWASNPEKVGGITDVSAYCVCPLGRWSEKNHREKSAEVHKKTPDLANVLAGRSFWRMNPAWMVPVDTSGGVRMVPVPAAPDPKAVEASRDCPECHGTGWAKRRAKWHSIDRPYVVDLFCRCPLGAWRHAHDPDVKRNYDSLQANPQVWDATLSHRTWSNRHILRDVATVDGTEDKWRYLKQSEPAPPVGDLHEMARRVSGEMTPKGRRLDWAEPIPKDLPMPRPVPRLTPPPEPPPPPCPKSDHDGLSEDQLKWM